MIKFAHVGFPKCASTWLQNEIFPKHKDIFFLGRRPGDDIISDEVRTLFWSTLIDEREYLYSKMNTENILHKYIEDAKNDDKSAIGISLEQLLHPHIGHLEFSERARRLYDFMGDGTKIIIIIREQAAWVQSYYSNLVSECGLAATFDEFMLHFFNESDISPLSTLYYDRVFTTYTELFGVDNVIIIPMEQIKENASSFTNNILNFIGLEHMDNLNPKKKNESVSDEQFATQLSMNIQSGFRLGRDTSLNRPFGWQVRSLFGEGGKYELPQKYIDDHERYKQNWAIGTNSDKSRNNKNLLKNVNRLLSEEQIIRLRQVYAESNKKLEVLCNFKLSKYGYST